MRRPRGQIEEMQTDARGYPQDIWISVARPQKWSKCVAALPHDLKTTLRFLNLHTGLTETIETCP
jgi:hypothetical protein